MGRALQCRQVTTIRRKACWPRTKYGDLASERRCQQQRNSTPRGDSSRNVKSWHLADMPAPKDTYEAPKTTAHQYGWYNNLEMFGVAEYGFKRVAHDWPAPVQNEK